MLHTWASTLPVLAKTTEKVMSCSRGAGEGLCLEPESQGADLALIFPRLGTLTSVLAVLRLDILSLKWRHKDYARQCNESVILAVGDLRVGQGHHLDCVSYKTVTRATVKLLGG